MPGDRLIRELGRVELEVLGIAAAVLCVLSVPVLSHVGRTREQPRSMASVCWANAIWLERYVEAWWSFGGTGNGEPINAQREGVTSLLF